MKLHLNNVRISFANGLFNASSVEDGGVKKFGADFIIGPDTKVFEVKADGSKVPTTMKAAELAVANDTWKGKGQQMLDALEPSKRAHRDGSKKLDKGGNLRDGYDGNWYVTAKDVKRPTVVGAGRQPVTEEDGVIYSGCHVNAIIELYGNSVPTKKGVFASLKGVQFFKDGDSFGGGAAAKADEFEDVSEGAAAEDFA